MRIENINELPPILLILLIYYWFLPFKVLAAKRHVSDVL
jgi:hypothetical protein